MTDLKMNLIQSFTPKAVLLPLTPEASSTIAQQCDKNVIPIMRFPFKVGRESRVGENERGLFLKLRIKKTEIEPNNDLYLIDSGKNLQVSKEHFEIIKTNNFYLLKDRGSTMGTTINDITYGGNKQEFEQVLNDGDIIKVGSKDSLYKFQFLVLDIKKA